MLHSPQVEQVWITAESYVPYCLLVSVPLVSTPFFLERILLQNNKTKEGFSVNELLTQTRHPAGDGRFQSPFPDES